MKRWLCETCGRGVNAPERMRTNDSRRYCLTCSAKSPTLVERICPAAKTRRKRKQGRRTAKAAAAKSHRVEKAVASKGQLAELPWHQRDDLIRAEFRRLVRLPIWRERVARYKPRLKIRRSSTRWHDSGRAKWSGEIVTTFGTGADRARICELLTHEICHYATDGGRGGRFHGDKFRGLLVDAVRVAYGATLDADEEIPRRAYSLDTVLECAIRKTLTEGETR